MVLVMNVRVVVLLHLVPMLVLMPLSEMQPQPKAHQRRRNNEEDRRVLSEDGK